MLAKVSWAQMFFLSCLIVLVASKVANKTKKNDKDLKEVKPDTSKITIDLSTNS